MRFLFPLVAVLNVGLLAACSSVSFGPVGAPSVTPYPFVTATARSSATPTPVTPTPLAALSTRLPTLTSLATGNGLATPVTPTRTPVPSATIPGVAAGPCQILPTGMFRTIYLSDPGLPPALGCPTSPPASDVPPRVWPVTVRYQPFEQGHLLWLSNVGWYESPVVYALFEDGSYTRFDDTYDPNVDPSQGGPEPPEGLSSPTEALGKVWRQNRSVRDRIGFATGLPLAEDTQMQMFAYGEMVSLPSLAVVFVFRRGDPNAWSVHPIPSE